MYVINYISCLLLHIAAINHGIGADRFQKHSVKRSITSVMQKLIGTMINDAYPSSNVNFRGNKQHGIEADRFQKHSVERSIASAIHKLIEPMINDEYFSSNENFRGNKQFGRVNIESAKNKQFQEVSDDGDESYSEEMNHSVEVGKHQNSYIRSVNSFISRDENPMLIPEPAINNQNELEINTPDEHGIGADKFQKYSLKRGKSSGMQQFFETKINDDYTSINLNFRGTKNHGIGAKRFKYLMKRAISSAMQNFFETMINDEYTSINLNLLGTKKATDAKHRPYPTKMVDAMLRKSGMTHHCMGMYKAYTYNNINNYCKTFQSNKIANYMMNTSGVMKMIVNTSKCQQYLPLIHCYGPGLIDSSRATRKCSSYCNMREIQCQQHYSMILLLTVDINEEKIEFDSFSFPSSCEAIYD